MGEVLCRVWVETKQSVKFSGLSRNPGLAVIKLGSKAVEKDPLGRDVGVCVSWSDTQ